MNRIICSFFVFEILLSQGLCFGFYFSNIDKFSNGDLLLSGTVKKQEQYYSYLGRYSEKGFKIWEQISDIGSKGKQSYVLSDGDLLSFRDREATERYSVLRLTSAGELEWMKDMGDAGYGEAYDNAVATRIDKDTFIISRTNRNTIIAELINGQGEMLDQWNVALKQCQAPLSYHHAKKTPDKGLVMSVYCESSGHRSAVIHIGPSGDLRWEVFVPNASSIVALAVSDNGEIAVTGIKYYSSSTDSMAFVNKLTAEGNLVWNAALSEDNHFYSSSSLQFMGDTIIASGTKSDHAMPQNAKKLFIASFDIKSGKRLQLTELFKSHSFTPESQISFPAKDGIFVAGRIRNSLSGFLGKISTLGTHWAVNISR